MFCPNCGNNCGDARFCFVCGTQLRSDGKSFEDDSFKDVMLLCDEFLGDELEPILQEHKVERPNNHADTSENTTVSVDQFIKDLKPLIQKQEKPNHSLIDEMEKRRIHTEAFQYGRRAHGLPTDLVCPKCGSTYIFILRSKLYYYFAERYTDIGLRNIATILLDIIIAILKAIRYKIFGKKLFCARCRYTWRFR